MKFVKHILPPVCIALITVIISQMLYLNIMENEKQRCWQELSTTVKDLNKEIEVKFKDEIAKLYLIKEMMITDEAFLPEDISFFHFDIFQPSTIFTRIDVLYPDNTIVSNGKIIEVDEDIKFEQIKEKGEYLTDRKSDFLNGTPCVYYVLPISSEDDIRAVLIAVIDLNVLDELFQPVIYNGNANICIIDSADGNYIMDSWHKELGNVYEMQERKLVKEYENVDLKGDIKNLKTGAIAFVSKTTGENLYMYYTPLKMFGWETAVFAQESVLFQNTILLRRKFIIAGIVEVLLLLAYFLWNTYLIKKLQKSNEEIEEKRKELEFLSYRDMLTNLYNRHKYTENIAYIEKSKQSEIGVVYIDLNGLKQMNDLISHEKGDEYIGNTANILTGVFGDNCYRIGGDEFVVLMCNIAQNEFVGNITIFKDNMKKNKLSASVGYMWMENCDDLNRMIHEAEIKMYMEKQKYYEAGCGS